MQAVIIILPPICRMSVKLRTCHWVETPVHVDGAGIHPVHVGALPEAVAELCRRELMVAQLSVDAAVEGSYEKALQCLLLDPVITDMHVAKTTLDDYLMAYKDHLPQFHR